MKTLHLGAIILTGLCALQSQSLGQQAASITSAGVDENGKFAITFEGNAGEYTIESTDDLTANNWVGIQRLTTNGSATDVSDPIDDALDQKFYRIIAVPSSGGGGAGGSTIAAEFSSRALSDPTLYGNLQTVFGLDFASNDGATLLGAAGLSSAPRNARVYTAMIGALAILTESIANDTNTFPSFLPDDDDVIDALIADISDGKLDGKDGGSTIEIGSTGVNLPSLTQQDFLDSFNTLKTQVFTLYNVNFASSGAGTTSASTSADWGTFYWDSADWQ